MPLPRITKEVAETWARDVIKIMTEKGGKGGRTLGRSFISQVGRENKILLTFLIRYAKEEIPAEEHLSFFRGAYFTYKLLSQQAEVADLDNSFKI